MCYLPHHLLQKFKVTEKMIFQGPKSEEDVEAIRNIAHDVASQAYAHMKAAREQFEKVDLQDRKKTMKGLLSAVNTDLILQALEKNSFDPYITATQLSQRAPLTLQYHLFKSYWKSSF